MTADRFSAARDGGWRIVRWAGRWSLAVVAASRLAAGPIEVPNGSFESPAVTFVGIDLASWQKSAKPDDYVEDGGFLWSQLSGLFKNTAPGSFDHLVNCDGNQAVWLFAVPGVELFQDRDALAESGGPATPLLEAVYQVGRGYRLTVGVLGTSGGMKEGVTLDLSLYYREGPTNRITLARTTVTNQPSLFPDRNHLVDFTVTVPPVNAADPWVDRPVGISFRSTVTDELQGGYWDLDHVRLEASDPAMLAAEPAGDGRVRLILTGQAGAEFEILGSDRATAPVSSWESRARVTNETGRVEILEPTTNAVSRFYRARQLP